MGKSWRYDEDELPVDRKSMKRMRKDAKVAKREAAKKADEVFDVMETIDEDWGDD